VRAANLVISCVSPASADGQELEDWLAKAVAGLGPEAAALYPARPDQSSAEAERIWFVTVGDETASDGARITSLLAEMRLLGLRPRVFSQGSTSPRLIA
jgi:hypothetical protein